MFKLFLAFCFLFRFTYDSASVCILYFCPVLIEYDIDNISLKLSLKITRVLKLFKTVTFPSQIRARRVITAQFDISNAQGCCVLNTCAGYLTIHLSRLSSQSLIAPMPCRLSSARFISHRLNFFRGMPLPIQDFTHHSQRLTGAVVPRRISRKHLIRQIGIILNVSGGLHPIYFAGFVARRQFRSPCGRIQCRGQVDAIDIFPFEYCIILTCVDKYKRHHVYKVLVNSV